MSSWMNKSIAPWSEPCVFVVGVPRSGTTLLCAMLSRHPELYVTNELPWHLFDALERDSVTSTELMSHVRGHSVFDDYLVHVNDVRQLTAWHLLEGALTHRMQNVNKKKWGVKDPRLTHYLPEFARRYPQARFVIILRDARATTASILRQRFHIANAYYGAQLWKRDVEAQLKFARENPDRTFICRYAELVGEPTGSLQRICAFLGLEYADEMLDSAVRTDIVIHEGNKNVMHPPMAELTESWKSELTPTQIAVVDSVAGELLEKLGFETTQPRRRISAVQAFGYWLHQQVVTNCRWQARTRFRWLPVAWDNVLRDLPSSRKRSMARS